MDLCFADGKLQHIVESRVRSDAHFGSADAGLVRQRLCELAAADNLAIAASVPTLSLHASEVRADGFVVSVRPHLRVLFEIGDGVGPTERKSLPDLRTVAAIRILALEECDEP
jgi:hypothetical protein